MIIITTIVLYNAYFTFTSHKTLETGNKLQCLYTVEPPNKGQAGSSYDLCREVGPYSISLSLSVKHSNIGSFHTKWPL